MNIAVNFILESGVSLALLSLIYILFLRKETFFRLNRIFLLISITFSVLLPFLKFRVYEPQPVMLAEITVTPYRNLIEAVTIYGQDFSGTIVNTISSSRIIILFYFVGLLFFLGRFIFRLIQISTFIRKNNVQQVDGVKFVSIDKDFSPFSFLRYIFLNPEKKQEKGYEKMIAHEMEHIKQGHTFDVLILELMTVLQWFNPFMWILKKVIRENHEFLADKAVLDSGMSPAQYKHLLLTQAVGFQLEIVNNFNSSLIKKRIQMISKISSSKYGKLKILLGLVVVFSLLTAFAFEEKKVSFKKNDRALVLNLDELITRNTVELQYITGVVNNSETNKAAVEKLRESYKLDYRYGIYNVSWKRNYENAVFYIDGKEASFEEMERLENRNAITVIGNAKELKPFIEKYGERAKNGVYFVYGEIEYKELFNHKIPVVATNITIPGVLDQYYKKQLNTDSVHNEPPVIINMDGKQMAVSGDGVELEDVIKLLMSNDKYNIVILRETNTINLIPNKLEAKKHITKLKNGEPVFLVVEEMPQFPGGEKGLSEYISKTVKYPEIAKENGIQGKVFVTFVVSKEGEIQEAKIARGVDASIDQEAIRVITELPKWKPAMQRGTAVNVNLTVPINFVLGPQKIKEDLKPMNEKNK